MRIVAERNLRDYWHNHADVEGPLRQWIAEAKAANWTTPHGVKSEYGNASILGNCRICFNIKGNDYRLIVAISYLAGVVLVKFIGTHAEYSRIDADKVEMF